MKIAAEQPEMFEYSNGTREWRQGGRRHCEDGPAVEYSDGDRAWYHNGRLHREDGPAVEFADGRHQWWVRGQLHREDGPAVEWVDGTRAWYIRGQLHREDGPAVEYANGNREWWIRGQELTEEEFKSQTKNKGKAVKITAEQARELAGFTPAEHVEAVYPMIRAAAEKRQRSIRIGTGFWAEEGYKTSEAYKQACKLLEADGFTVKFYYAEHQFVDMGTEISW